MIYRMAVLSAVLLATAEHRSPAQAVGNIYTAKGICKPSSSTAEGPLGSDLTDRQSRFYCDTAVISFFGNDKGHLLIDFSEKESKHPQVLGFAGQVLGGSMTSEYGVTLQVKNVYLRTGEPTTVSDGTCTLFFKDLQLSGIGCAMKVDETGRRTVAIVAFDVTPGQNLQLNLNPGGSITNPSPGKLQMGTDGLEGGSPGDIWQKVQSDGREIFAKMNGRYYATNPPLATMEHPSGYGFLTDIVANLPDSTVVGGPESVMHMVEGNCETRHYSVLGSIFFSRKNRSGIAMESTPAENVERTLVPNSPFEKAFDLLCKIAREQKSP